MKEKEFLQQTKFLINAMNFGKNVNIKMSDVLIKSGEIAQYNKETKTITFDRSILLKDTKDIAIITSKMSMLVSNTPYIESEDEKYKVTLSKEIKL